MHYRVVYEAFYTRWEQDAGQTVTFSVPNNWTAGRIWVGLARISLHRARLLAVCLRATAGPP